MLLDEDTTFEALSHADGTRSPTSLWLAQAIL
jgi:hypothetical protein